MMAAMIGDVFAADARFHGMMGPGLKHQHSHDAHYRSVSRSRDRDMTQTRASPRRRDSTSSASKIYSAQGERVETPSTRETPVQGQGSSAGASVIPTPPSSSSSSEASSSSSRPQDGTPPYVPASTAVETVISPAETSAVSSTSTVTESTIVTIKPPSSTMPSPPSSNGPPHGSAVATAAPAASRDEQGKKQTTVIRIRDLAHIESLCRTKRLPEAGPATGTGVQTNFEISAMPVGDVIEMVAALLTKITTTNDHQHDALNRNATHVKQAQAQANTDDGTAEPMSPFSSSVLAFHGKNVPAITILSYLSRIHKYCPTTFEVFLSLLVYFDRMTEQVNKLVWQSEERRKSLAGESASKETTPDADDDVLMRDGSDDTDETEPDLAVDEDKSSTQARPVEQKPETARPSMTRSASSAPHITASPQATFFVVDSFNIHRLIIAGVTCASKFFSDVFYTNSRYAKVGGLPLGELNHLEVQFLELNDFRLAVTVEKLETYATMLVEFYAREVLAPNMCQGEASTA